MRYAIYSLLWASLSLLLTACDQSVREAADDVRSAQENAAERIDAERRDVEDVAKSAEDNLIQENRELQDAAREESEKILKEQRDLEDAKRREADENPNP
jgi:signal transduction histidine kinase